MAQPASPATRAAELISRLANAPEKGLTAGLSRLSAPELAAFTAALESLCTDLPEPPYIGPRGSLPSIWRDSIKNE